MFWSFRHQITRQTALDCLVQFALFLSSLKPEHIYITQETGTLSTVHYHIPISKETGEFVHEQHIPFRLTPNMITLMGPISLSGPMVFSMIAAARCLIDPKLGTEAILAAILKDEVQASIKDMTEPRVISMIEDIQSAVNQIMSRLQTAANFDKAESKLPSIISLTTTPENLCRLDPAWYPWL
ncbi:transformation/transcription domain-associated protein-like [Bolinopsis microptera]|uniref:transformation/transcription domain-associated protein-like n=1 Tax=Bolinopsis microptera TaxID=2820187 RepID=UPI003079EAAB